MATSWFRRGKNKNGSAGGRDSRKLASLNLACEQLEDRLVPAGGITDPIRAPGSGLGDLPGADLGTPPVDETPTDPAPTDPGIPPVDPGTIITPPTDDPPPAPPPPVPEPTRDEKILAAVNAYRLAPKVPFNIREAMTSSVPGTQLPQLSPAELAARRTGALLRYEQYLNSNPRALITISETEPNDTPATANPAPLGNGPGQDPDVNVNGTIGAAADVDFFAVDLQAGDILGAVVVGQGGLDSVLAVFDPNGLALMANNDDAISGARAPECTLPVSANPIDPYVSIVVGQTGRYLVSVAGSAGSTGSYQLQMAARRPVLEQGQPGDKQKIFLDFDGATIPPGVIGATGGTMSPLANSLGTLGLTPADLNPLIDSIIANLQRVLDEQRLGGAVPGTNPNYDFEILNSRDDADTFGSDPLVSRIVIGGTVQQVDPTLPFGVIGVAQFVEPGNFSTDDTAIIGFEDIAADAGNYPLGAGVSIIDVAGALAGTVAAHEGGHYFGLLHTDPGNANLDIIDTFYPLINLGADGLFGTPDDLLYSNLVDAYDLNQGNSGNEDTTNHIAWGLTSVAAPSGASGIFGIDVSSSMDTLSGIDVNRDGFVTIDDDVNGDGTHGSLLDVALQQILDANPTLSTLGIFGRDAAFLDASLPDPTTQQRSQVIVGGTDSNGDGISDFEEIVRSINIGQGGIFSESQVVTQPTNYESILRAVLTAIRPGTTVTLFSDGSGRLPANSEALAALVQAGIRVNTVTIGPYQTVAPVDDFTRISAATGGTNTVLNPLDGRSVDGGFTPVGTTTVSGGGTGGPHRNLNIVLPPGGGTTDGGSSGESSGGGSASASGELVAGGGSPGAGQLVAGSGDVVAADDRDRGTGAAIGRGRSAGELSVAAAAARHQFSGRGGRAAAG
ncbi:MAG TPA: hypothetical protein VNC50_00970 [Planctomycetia bacterium]|nr:hypothetical protein [Planctomycetia bacterium]